MPKRKIDPNTGDRMLTAREEKLIHQFLANGGNGTRAAVSAGYSAARPSSSAYQVLHRPEVQRRIRQRIQEWQVSAHEDQTSPGSRTMSLQATRRNSMFINVFREILATSGQRGKLKHNPQKLNVYQCFSGPSSPAAAGLHVCSGAAR